MDQDEFECRHGEIWLPVETMERLDLYAQQASSDDAKEEEPSSGGDEGPQALNSRGERGRIRRVPERFRSESPEKAPKKFKAGKSRAIKGKPKGKHNTNKTKRTQKCEGCFSDNLVRTYILAY